MNSICVLGLGYIGLPTACMFATHGFKVVGVDVNGKILDKVRQGRPHIKEKGLDLLVETAVQSGNFEVCSHPKPCDVFIVAVPTPITSDKKADLSFVKTAAESILPVLQTENLVVLESTSPPGTTKDILVPILAKSGLKVGEELFVAYCPERVLPGVIIEEIVNNNRIIGGVNRKSAEIAKRIYSSFVKGNIFLTDATTAEMVKLMENTFRDVNIALANELANICEELGINVWEAIELANKHPRINYHKPGPGVGGHCIPIDPWFIVEKFPEKTQLIRQSRDINDRQPKHVFDLIARMTSGMPSPKIAILGVSYKGNVDDVRESPAETLIGLLKDHEYTIAVYDPYVGEFEEKPVTLEEAFLGADCAVIVADHDQFRDLDPSNLGNLMRHKQILDTRNLIDATAWRNAGFRVVILGDGKQQCKRGMQ
ncbi:MAG TPA: nucleotide sugar dehydrogenase [Tepidanaerobacter syntrophicus]|jgi:UDP-N-acetyl-D-mannosaminuronic acid dehydrogenase|uniref:nucleotide sugar dehydrogenase n=1 Tax=Tepidanaerobacter syntrophicus TaxID=224999 RepID=UPI001769F673|nr:nucleotide sugar dehydrogenase [Tepidanaerobacter syntrophicus]HHV82833.1 nucleotide sugar dehydrogenase [Tepidanaerobacter syntrophicus]